MPEEEKEKGASKAGPEREEPQSLSLHRVPFNEKVLVVRECDVKLLGRGSDREIDIGAA